MAKKISAVIFGVATTSADLVNLLTISLRMPALTSRFFCLCDACALNSIETRNQHDDRDAGAIQNHRERINLHDHFELLFDLH
ncbi:hypothetical protein [Planctomicrobium piriforme]|uniref:hypothetical protein n=1 Tax=Planctomicrobium piriforme TaxID=1576369 RepID=UPI001113B040|nr:hypothetical protein [Planctomicrobium piriforme]